MTEKIRLQFEACNIHQRGRNETEKADKHKTNGVELKFHLTKSNAKITEAVFSLIHRLFFLLVTPLCGHYPALIFFVDLSSAPSGPSLLPLFSHHSLFLFHPPHSPPSSSRSTTPHFRSESHVGMSKSSTTRNTSRGMPPPSGPPAPIPSRT